MKKVKCLITLIHMITHIQWCAVIKRLMSCHKKGSLTAPQSTENNLGELQQKVSMGNH